MHKDIFSLFVQVSGEKKIYIAIGEFQIIECPFMVCEAETLPNLFRHAISKLNRFRGLTQKL